MKNLLIVEDDIKIREMMSLYFAAEGYNILEAETGQDAITIFKNEKIDLVFLDVMLPEMNGLKVCELIREKSDIPIIIITARSQEEDKLHGFDYGADEYVTKPFSLKVLAARANALMKRVDGIVSKGDNVLEYSGLSMNLSSGEVSIDGTPIILTRKEYDLLLFFIRNKGMILSRELILDKVWGFDYNGDPRTVDTHIRRLREKLANKKNLIQNSRGRGYFLAVEEQLAMRREDIDVQK